MPVFHSFLLTEIILFCIIPGIYPQQSSEEGCYSVIGVGDIMLGTDYPDNRYLPAANNCHPLMEAVIPYLKDADITFGNLEGSFAGNKGKPKLCRDTMNCYIFRMPESYISCILEAGFDLLSLANNHSGDFGEEGQANTMNLLDSAGIAYAGLSQCPTAIIIRDSVRFGFCAFAPSRGTCSLTDITAASEIVRNLERTCDVVIVSFHGGAEGKDHQHITREPEIYLGFNRGNVYEFAHAVIDAGGDIVFGHGPHVTRAIEIYRNRLICYSLGNFCTFRRFNLQGPNGFSPLIRAEVNANGEFVKGMIIPVRQTGTGGTKPDPERNAVEKIQELTNSDFPDIPLEITDEGLILIK